MQTVRPDTNNDMLAKLDGFIQSRETLAQSSPNVLGFLDARTSAAAQPSDNVYEFGSTLTQQQMLKLQSGYYGVSEHSAFSSDREEEQQKKEKEDQLAVRRFNQIAQEYSQLAENVFFHQENVARLFEEHQAAQAALAQEQQRLTVAQDAVAAMESTVPAVPDSEANAIRDERATLEANAHAKYNELGENVTVQLDGGTTVERKEITIDGQTYQVNGIGAVFDQDGKILSDDQVATLMQSQDPSAQGFKEFMQASDAFDEYKRTNDRRLIQNAERNSMFGYRDYQEERVLGAAQDVQQTEQALEEGQEALDAAEQQLQEFKKNHPEVTVGGQRVSLNEAGDYVDANGGVVDIAQVQQAALDAQNPQPTQMATLVTPETYDSNQTARRAETQTPGLVGGTRIESGGIRLGSDFRGAASPDQATQPAPQPDAETTPALKQTEIAYAPQRQLGLTA